MTYFFLSARSLILEGTTAGTTMHRSTIETCQIAGKIYEEYATFYIAPSTTCVIWMYAVVGVEAIQLQRLYKKNVQLLKFKVSLAIGADTGESDIVTLCVCRLGFQQIALPTVSNEKALQMHSIDTNSSQFRDPIKKCDWSRQVVMWRALWRGPPVTSPSSTP